MANDNKAFLKCFGETMDKMLHVGYRKGELVPTGEVSCPSTSVCKWIELQHMYTRALEISSRLFLN